MGCVQMQHQADAHPQRILFCQPWLWTHLLKRASQLTFPCNAKDGFGNARVEHMRCSIKQKHPAPSRDVFPYLACA